MSELGCTPRLSSLRAQDSATTVLAPDTGRVFGHAQADTAAAGQMLQTPGSAQGTAASLCSAQLRTPTRPGRIRRAHQQHR